MLTSCSLIAHPSVHLTRITMMWRVIWFHGQDFHFHFHSHHSLKHMHSSSIQKGELYPFCDYFLLLHFSVLVNSIQLAESDSRYFPLYLMTNWRTIPVLRVDWNLCCKFFSSRRNFVKVSSIAARQLVSTNVVVGEEEGSDHLAVSVSCLIAAGCGLRKLQIESGRTQSYPARWWVIILGTRSTII